MDRNQSFMDALRKLLADQMVGGGDSARDMTSMLPPTKGFDMLGGNVNFTGQGLMNAPGFYGNIGSTGANAVGGAHRMATGGLNTFEPTADAWASKMAMLNAEGYMTPPKPKAVPKKPAKPKR